MNKLTLAALALFVGISALPRRCDAAQMALQLEGDVTSFFAAPDSISLDENIGSALTIEAWVNPAINLATDDHGNEYIILNKEDSYEIAVRNADPEVEGTFQCAIQPDGGGWLWTEATEGTVPINKWTHVAATWDGLVIRTFVNGKLNMTYEQPGPDGKGVLRSTDASLKVGRRVRGEQLHSIFDGLIDEVRISKVVRYPEAGFDPPTQAFAPDADTVALYHFDEVLTGAAEIQALKEKLDALYEPDDDGAPLDIRGVVKDASSFHNDGALIKNAKLVAADTPIKEVTAP